MIFTFSLIFNLLIILLSLFATFYFYLKYKHNYWSKRGVYSPPCHWLFGHFKEFFLLKKSPMQIIEDLYNSAEEDVGYIGFYILYKPFLLVRELEGVKNVLIKDFPTFCNRSFAYKQKCDNITKYNLFSENNPDWKNIRTKLSPMFTSGKQKSLFLIMLECAEYLKNYLDTNVQDKTSHEVRGIAMKYTLDVISSLSFGIRINSFVEPKSDFYKVFYKSFMDSSFITGFRLFLTFFFPEHAHLAKSNVFGTDIEFTRKVFWDSMNNRENSEVKRGDAIDTLLSLKNKNHETEYAKFKGDYLVAQASVLLGAGVNTSALTISYTLLELAKNPEIQAKVHKELQEKLPKDGLTYETVSELTYLQQVISETLRLYPPAPLIDRIAMKDYKFPGSDVTVEKETAVFITLNGIQKDEKYHPDPLKYDPDRFSVDRKNEMPTGSYMPFGDGPRICIGMRTGSLQTLVCLATILSKCKVSLNPKSDYDLSKKAIFLTPDENGINLYFEKLTEA